MISSPVSSVSTQVPLALSPDSALVSSWISSFSSSPEGSVSVGVILSSTVAFFASSIDLEAVSKYSSHCEKSPFINASFPAASNSTTFSVSRSRSVSSCTSFSMVSDLPASSPYRSRISSAMLLLCWIELDAFSYSPFSISNSARSSISRGCVRSMKEGAFSSIWRVWLNSSMITFLSVSVSSISTTTSSTGGPGISSSAFLSCSSGSMYCWQ